MNRINPRWRAIFLGINRLIAALLVIGSRRQATPAGGARDEEQNTASHPGKG